LKSSALKFSVLTMTGSLTFFHFLSLSESESESESESAPAAPGRLPSSISRWQSPSPFGLQSLFAVSRTEAIMRWVGIWECPFNRPDTYSATFSGLLLSSVPHSLWYGFIE
jgi:hypothetical protein